jgi:predicted DNA-binding transcriptional regulator YafY
MATALDTARQRLASYLEAEARILSAGQASAVGTRNRRDAELEAVRKAIKELQSEVAALEDSASGVSSLITVVPR